MQQEWSKIRERSSVERGTEAGQRCQVRLMQRAEVWVQIIEIPETTWVMSERLPVLQTQARALSWRDSSSRRRGD